MNALTCLKLALRTRSGWIFKGLLAAAGVVWLGSCSPGGGAGAVGPYDSNGAYVEGWADSPDKWRAASPAPALAPATSLSKIPWNSTGPGGAVSQAEAFAKPVKERPGLATQWGGSVKSVLGDTRFSRASTKPYGVDVIYYNDAEGLAAMGAKDRKVDGMTEAAGGILEWGIRGNFGMLPAYRSYSSGRRYVEGRNGSGYSIMIKNRCKSRILVVLSVDGLDVMDGKPASTARPGYVINAGDTLEVKGFRTSYDAVAAFKFSTVSGSYAATRHGDTRNVGVIGLAAFLEKGCDPWKWMPAEIDRRESATPFATPR